MYCPRCGATNIDGAKFCRGCGTNLDTVALALSDPAAVGKANRKKSARSKHKNWIDKRRDGTKNFMQGIGLMTASALLGVALALFSNNPDWIIVWLVIVGWVTVWGVVSITSGISDLLESRFLRREFEDAEDSAREQLHDRPTGVADSETSPNLKLPPSVTENTTKLLTKSEP